jgi:hypothetical protein
MYEVANGIYEGGFALLVATNVRVILIDKKPLNFLTVEDLRFDMINEIDYSHRLVGAQISISTGPKTLKFRSYNQARLRKLINHVQHCMAEAKQKQTEHQQGQSQHLERINQQLQSYLLAQHMQQQEIQERIKQAQADEAAKIVDLPEPVKPSPELADYLFAQSLLAQNGPAEKPEASNGAQVAAGSAQPPKQPTATKAPPPSLQPDPADLYQAGVREVFGNSTNGDAAQQLSSDAGKSQPGGGTNPLELSPLRIAYSKLPMALRNRKFGSPSFHAHSEAPRAAAHP